jgi:hypothetical protein
MKEATVERTVYLKSQEVLIQIEIERTTWIMTGTRVKEPPAGVEEYATLADLQQMVYLPLGIGYYHPSQPGAIDRFLIATIEDFLGMFRRGKYKDYGKVLWTRTGTVKHLKG